MYTAPDETTSIVKSIKLYNTHGSNLVVDIKVYDFVSCNFGRKSNLQLQITLPLRGRAIL